MSESHIIDLSTGKAVSKRTKATSTATHDGSLFDAQGRRIIRHQPSQLPEILDALEVALSESGTLNLFRYAGRLARVYQADESADKNIKRPAGAIMLHPVESAHLAEIATRAAAHEKWDARRSDFVPIDCPRRVADAYLARGHWPRLPDLLGFIETPTITASGRVIDAPGYDKDSGLFCAFRKIPGYQRPPEKPSKDEAVRAADRLIELFKTFPFVSEEDHIAMLAGVLSLGHDDAETEKRLAGAFMAGDACLMVDNVERPLGGDLICQALTQEYLRLRPLGGSGMLNVPTHSLMIATGNNLSIIGDLKRRVVLVRLDARVERPEHRTFGRDHLSTVLERRGEIITDAMTIIAAYLAAGSPAIPGLHSFGGFEKWDAMVRRPLAWLGLADPLLSSDELRAADPDMECMRLLFAAWRDEFGTRPVTAAEVVSSSTSVGQSANDDLRDALQLACAEKPNTRRLSGWLRRHKDKILDGLQLKQNGIDGNKKVAKWQVLECGVCG